MKRIYCIILLTVLALFFWACKKEEQPDQLEGNLLELVGTWEWEYTEHTVELCAPEFTYTVTLTPESQNFEYYVMFEQKGTVSLYRNEQLIGIYYIYIDYQTIQEDNNLHFGLGSINNSTKFFGSLKSKDTLFLHRQPFDTKDDYCIDYDNYFIRQ